MRRDDPLSCRSGAIRRRRFLLKGRKLPAPDPLGEAVWLKLEFLSCHEIKLPDAQGIRLSRCRSQNRAFGLVRPRSAPLSSAATESTSLPTIAWSIGRFRKAEIFSGLFTGAPKILQLPPRRIQAVQRRAKRLDDIGPASFPEHDESEPR